MSNSTYSTYTGDNPKDPATQDKYEVQVAKQGGTYKTKLATNKKGQALMHYEGWNVGKGYRKRILLNGKTVQRSTGVE